MQALRLGHQLELRIDACLYRTLSEQISAERVNGAKPCLLEVRQSLLEVVAGRGVLLFCAALSLEVGAETKLELARSFLGESHACDAVDCRLSSRDHCYDSLHHFARFPGACGSLNHQGLVEGRADSVAGVLIDEFHQARPLMAFS